MTPNVNPATGIRYGIISANTLYSDVIDKIQQGNDIRWETAVKELENTVKQFGEDDEEFGLEYQLEKLADSWYDDEPIHEFDIDGVKGRTTWLGGALLVWIFESPYTVNAKLCSPCVPNCGDLDNLDSDGYECYNVPEDWRYKE